LTTSGNIIVSGSSARHIQFKDSSELEGSITFDETADGFIFKVGGTGGSLTDAMKIDTAGKTLIKDNLVVGTTTVTGSDYQFSQNLIVKGSTPALILDETDAEGFITMYANAGEQYLMYDHAGSFNIKHATSTGGSNGTDVLTLSGSGNATFGGNVALTSADTWEPQLTITNTNNNANPGQLQFWKRPADSSEADNDILGQIGFAGLNDANADTWYQTMYVKALDVSDGSEDFGFYMDGHVAGVGDTNVFKIESGKATFSGQCQADSFITGDLILKSPTNNGHYTIWEEEEYLAIRNEMTGKKYKFVLEEIDE
jgi:hypothetical protein